MSQVLEMDSKRSNALWEIPRLCVKTTRSQSDGCSVTSLPVRSENMSESFLWNTLPPHMTQERWQEMRERGMTNGTGPNCRVGTLCSWLARGNKVLFFCFTFLQEAKFFSTSINWASNKGLWDWRLQLVCGCDGQPSVVGNQGVRQQSRTMHRHEHTRTREVAQFHIPTHMLSNYGT